MFDVQPHSCERFRNRSAIFLIALVCAITLIVFSPSAMAQSVSCAGVSVWAANTSYSIGQLVTYSGVEYKCIQAHTSEVGWEPPNVPALWQLIGTCSSSATPTPTAKPTATATATAKPTATATATAKPTATATPKSTATPTATPNPEQPYGGTPWAIPGTIQAENFDTGGDNIGYYTASNTNQGGQYRTSEGVSIETTTDTGGGYDVGWTAAGEWLKYTVNVTASGSYTIQVRVANNETGGTFHFNVDGATATSELTLPNTGGWQTWQTIATTINLTAGQHVLELSLDTAGSTGNVGNFNWFSIGNLESPYGGTPWPLPGTVQAENFDTGGDNVGYYTASNTNQGGQYRTSEGVSIEATTDTGGGYDVGWTAAGEWLNYTVNVTAAGSYTIQVRVANNETGGTFHFNVDGSVATSELTLPNTGGWQTWQTISTAINLTAGQHIIQLALDTAGSTGNVGNFNWFSVGAASSSSAERQKVLNYLASISGNHTAIGVEDKSGGEADSDEMASMAGNGQQPSFWSADFGFGSAATASAREAIVQEGEKQWAEGAIVQYIYHACPLSWGSNEQGCAYEGGTDPIDGSFGDLTAAQWTDLTTPGGTLYGVWTARLDTLAVYFQELKDAGVAPLFRPLHEINGSWAWWQGRPGATGSARLYQITHDYLVNTKGLNNIIWVWNVQDYTTLASDVTVYTPGTNYFDIAALDVYNTGYTTGNYNAMIGASGGKPIGIAECQFLPYPATLAAQPLWTYVAVWPDFLYSPYQTDNSTQIPELFGDAQVVTLSKMPGW